MTRLLGFFFNGSYYYAKCVPMVVPYRVGRLRGFVCLLSIVLAKLRRLIISSTLMIFFLSGVPKLDPALNILKKSLCGNFSCC